MHRLAIDLGTSNTVAVLRGMDGQVRPVLFDGREQLPSAVHAGAGGVLVAGLDAERLARADPAAFEPNPKRRVDEGTVLLGQHTVDVAAALAAVLRTVADHAGPPPAGRDADPVVLTVPAGWGTPRRRVLADAAARAGLGAVEFVSEPVAAAAYFAATHRDAVPPGAALLVVDLGAGTADLAVVRDGQVVAQGGLDVGGLDVDAALVGVLGDLVGTTAPDVWHRLAAPVTAADRRDRLLLWQEVRAAKESLSRLSVAPVHVPGSSCDPHLTREELEAVAAPLLAPVVDLAAALTADLAARPVADPPAAASTAPAAGPLDDPDAGPPLAGVPAGPLDGPGTGGRVAGSGEGAAGGLAAVFLVGGGSRLPLLARLLHARLGVAPTAVERPETVVAEGALHAAAATAQIAASAAAAAEAAGEAEAAATAKAAATAEAMTAAAGGGTGPASGASASPRTPLRRRWRSPATVLLVLACFALPFATVSCGLPSGYGRAQPGGTTQYTGFDLASGGAPDVRPADQVRPPGQRRPDRLGPQPAHLAALVLLAAVLAAAGLGGDRRRRGVTAVLAVAAALALVTGQVLVTDRLAGAVVEQSRLPDGKTAADMVGTGAGFWATVVLLALLALGNLAALAPPSGRLARFAGRASPPGH